MKSFFDIALLRASSRMKLARVVRSSRGTTTTTRASPLDLFSEK